MTLIRLSWEQESGWKTKKRWSAWKIQVRSHTRTETFLFDSISTKGSPFKHLDSNQNQAQASAAASGGESPEENHTLQEEHHPDQNKTITTTVGDVLSVTQLVLRRGLTLVVMIVILVTGILINEFLMGLLKWFLWWCKAGSHTDDCQDWLNESSIKQLLPVKAGVGSLSMRHQAKIP